MFPCTYGNFILINIKVTAKETMTQRNPIEINRIRLNLGVVGLCVLSKMIKPIPPMVKKKLDANPSIMY